MLDEESDCDAISDKFEGYTDPDEDGLYNFIDFDSDGNSILDNQEKVNDKGLPLDSDYDDIADFLDLDNDGDYILDIHDSALYKKYLGIHNFTIVGTEVLEDAKSSIYQTSQKNALKYGYTGELWVNYTFTTSKNFSW